MYIMRYDILKSTIEMYVKTMIFEIPFLIMYMLGLLGATIKFVHETIRIMNVSFVYTLQCLTDKEDNNKILPYNLWSICDLLITNPDVQKKLQQCFSDELFSQ